MKADNWGVIDALVMRGRAWLDRPFPAGYGGEEVKGVDLVLLDMYAGSCITSFVSNKGWLERDQLIIVKKCRRELDMVVPLLEGEAQRYFEELRNITRDILQFLQQDHND